MNYVISAQVYEPRKKSLKSKARKSGARAMKCYMPPPKLRCLCQFPGTWALGLPFYNSLVSLSESDGEVQFSFLVDGRQVGS